MMQEFVTRPLSSTSDIQLPAGVVVRTVQGRESGFPHSVPPLRPLPSREERARQLLNEMERSEKMLADPALTPEGAQQLGQRIKELGGALEELLSCKGEAFGRKLWGEILGTGSLKSPGDQGYLLEALCGVRNERVHALVRGALTQCTALKSTLTPVVHKNGSLAAVPQVQGDSELFSLCAEHFAQTRDPSGLRTLLATARNSKCALSCRLEAIGALGKGSEKGLLSVLEPFLKDREARIRTATLEALSAAGSRELSGKVVGLLYDEVESVRLAAAQACARARCEATNAMLYPLSKSPLPAVRLAAVNALWLGESREALSVATAALKDPCRQVQLDAAAKILSSSEEEWGERIFKGSTTLRAYELMRVAAGLTDCQSNAARRFLAWAAESNNFDLRMQATEQIEKFPSPQGLEALSGQLQQEIWIGQESILQALASCRRVDADKVDALLLAARPNLDESVHPFWIQAAQGTAHPMLRRMLWREVSVGGSHGLQALSALGKPGSDEEESIFASNLAADSAPVRTYAALGLLRYRGSFSSAHLFSREFHFSLPGLLEGAVQELGAGEPKVAEDILALAEREFQASKRGGISLRRLVPAPVLGQFLKMVGVFP